MEVITKMNDTNAMLITRDLPIGRLIISIKYKIAIQIQPPANTNQNGILPPVLFSVRK